MYVYIQFSEFSYIGKNIVTEGLSVNTFGHELSCVRTSERSSQDKHESTAKKTQSIRKSVVQYLSHSFRRLTLSFDLIGITENDWRDFEKQLPQRVQTTYSSDCLQYNHPVD